MVVTQVYVCYTDDGKVIKIDNCPDSSFKNFQIDYELVKDLYDSRRDLSRYKIDYFYNISKGFVENIEQEIEVKTDMPFIISLTSSFNNEITLEHRPSMQCWTMYIRPDIADKINLVDKMSFYIVKKDDPNFLLGSVDLDISGSYDEIHDNKLTFPFAYEIEEHLNDFSLVVTNRIFKSYGIKEENVSEI